MVLAQFSPEERKDILVRLKGGTLSPQAPKSKPGFISRTLQSLNLPSTREELENSKPSVGDALGGPAYMAGKMAVGYGKGLYQAGKDVWKESFEAGQNIGEGGPVGANVKKVGAAVTDASLRKVLGPVGGGAVMVWGEDLASGNWSGAAGDALGVLINALMLGKSRPLGAEGKIAKISYAADMSRGVEDLKTILPDIEKATKGGPPKTVGDLLEGVNKAKDAMNNEAGKAMFRIRGRQYVPIDIADRIKSRITPDMQMTAEGRHIETMMRNAATDFQKPWTFEQLDALRMRWNSSLSGFYKMSPADKTAFLKNNPEVAIQLEVVDGIRDIVYPAMDQAAGKPNGFFAGLKQRQSTLIDLQRVLDGRVDELATQTEKIKGAPRLDQSNLSFYGAASSSSAHPGISLHRLHNVVVRPNPLGKANAAISRAFTGSTTAKAGIYSLPVRELMLEGAKKKEKKPAEQIKDLHKIINTTTSNPAMPTGEPQ